MSGNKTAAVRIDSRKFLSAINDSAQSKVAFFEERVSQMGKSAGGNWRLAALHAKNLYIEDVNSHQFYIADHVKEQHGKVTISNIRPLEIVEVEKQDLFSETCLKLVNAIEENDQKGMQTSFDRMKSQRFSGRAVPYSGMVKCRDGVLRQVQIASTSNSLEESTRAALVSTIVESLRDNVIVENGQVVAGQFSDGEPVKLPVTKWAARKLVARRMMESAKNAYWSKGFQQRIYEVARLVSESKIEDAVKFISPFLNEMEEFTLLNKNQVQTLVENSLAAQAIFNQQLCDDTATLMFRTNMKISRNKIIDEWRNIARRAEHPVLVENVKILEESRNFENSYQKFLSLIFETISNREVAAEALATTLDILRDKTPKIKESHDLSSKLNNLISRLKANEVDDAAIYEAEDLIATIQEELAAADSLQDFDAMPPVGGDSMEVGGDSKGGSGAPVININSPLIQIGGQSSAGDKEDEMLPDVGDVTDTEEDDLDELLGATEAPAPATPTAPAPAPAAPAAPAPASPAAPGLPESRNRGAMLESRPVHYEMKRDCDDDMPEDDEEDIEESYDPYAIGSKELKAVQEGRFISDYGAPVISDAADIEQILRVMQRLAVEHKLVGDVLEHNLPGMAKASMQALGIRIPTAKLDRAVEQVVTSFMEEAGNKAFPGAAPPFKKKGEHAKHGDKKSGIDDDGDGIPNWDDEDEGVAEDQYHKPSIPMRGYKKASINKMEEGRIRWRSKQDDAMLGECAGVSFIFDHGGTSGLKPVVLSEDGSVEIPIPEKLYSSAYSAANMAESADPADFVKWLYGSIEQLRPISDNEDLALSEAMAMIKTNPDGSISVEVTDDVDVDEIGSEMDDESEEMEDIGEMGEMDVEDESEDMEDMDEDEGMEPVESLDMSKMSDDEESEESREEMPDFEASEDMGPEEEVEEEGLAEDNDVTDPSKAKYTKHVKDNYREMPSPKLPKASDDELEDVGPDVKEDDGTGTKSPTAKKGNS